MFIVPNRQLLVQKYTSAPQYGDFSNERQEDDETQLKGILNMSRKHQKKTVTIHDPRTEPLVSQEENVLLTGIRHRDDESRSIETISQSIELKEDWKTELLDILRDPNHEIPQTILKLVREKPKPYVSDEAYCFEMNRIELDGHRGHLRIYTGVKYPDNHVYLFGKDEKRCQAIRIGERRYEIRKDEKGQYFEYDDWERGLDEDIFIYS